MLLVSDAAISALRVFGVFRDTATVFSGLTLDRWGLRIFDFHPNAANARKPDPCRVGASTYRHRITTHPLQIENVQRPVSSLSGTIINVLLSRISQRSIQTATTDGPWVDQADVRLRAGRDRVTYPPRSSQSIWPLHSFAVAIGLIASMVLSGGFGATG